MNSFQGNNSDDENAQDAASQTSTPNNEMEDTVMEDDNENESEESEADEDNEDDNNDDNIAEADEENENDEDDTGGKPKRSPSQPPSPQTRGPRLRYGADICTSYDVVPYVAAPQSTSINAITATPCMRWVFTGGQDGYIRKFDWFASINGKVPLTVAQRHPFVDSVTRAGVLLSYWENEEIPDKATTDQGDEIKFSPVYSLATQSQALWLLSGLESGNINLQSVRHDEGKIVTVLRKHKSAVSSLIISQDEMSVVSGSWDKEIHDWDLNRGETTRSYGTPAGQITALSWRPHSILPIPHEKLPLIDGISANAILTNGTATNAIFKSSPKENEVDVAALADTAPAASPSSPQSFGSLFGDDDDDLKVEEDDEFSQAVANGRRASASLFGDDNDLDDAKPLQNDTDGDAFMGDSQPVEDATLRSEPEPSANTNTNNANLINSSTESNNATVPSPHTEMRETDNNNNTPPASDMSNSVFLAASIDGLVRLFDRRQDVPITRIHPAKGTPPWCTSACWSTDGNWVYVGRRNGMVEEYSIHRGLKEPTRQLKFPQGSGAVSVVKNMPNGRHIICASYDNLRMYDLKEEVTKHASVPFLIVPGHHGGVVSDILIDPSCQFLITISGNRGFDNSGTTEVMLGYTIDLEGL